MPFHPAAYLLSTVSLMASLQVLGLPLLIVIAAALFLLLDTGSRYYWKTLVLRNRWLLIVLFLVFAYGLPGEGMGGFEWTPSPKGMIEASVHILRLTTLLGILASLLAQYHHAELLLGLWSLLAPLQRIGFPVERSIVRLALVLEALGEIQTKPRETHPTKITSLAKWEAELRNVLAPQAPQNLPEVPPQHQIQIQPRAWRKRDFLLILSSQIPLLGHTFSL